MTKPCNNCQQNIDALAKSVEVINKLTAIIGKMTTEPIHIVGTISKEERR